MCNYTNIVTFIAFINFKYYFGLYCYLSITVAQNEREICLLTSNLYFKRKTSSTFPQPPVLIKIKIISDQCTICPTLHKITNKMRSPRVGHLYTFVGRGAEVNGISFLLQQKLHNKNFVYPWLIRMSVVCI